MTQQRRNTLIVLAAVAVAFGGGAGWQFMKARGARMERDAALQAVAGIQQQRALEQLETTLALAAVAAQYGDFERGRQLASDFFELLQARASAAPEAARLGLNGILTHRDHIITMLSRARPESGFELTNLLTSLQNALGKEPTVVSDGPLVHRTPSEGEEHPVYHDKAGPPVLGVGWLRSPPSTNR